MWILNHREKEKKIQRANLVFKVLGGLPLIICINMLLSRKPSALCPSHTYVERRDGNSKDHYENSLHLKSGGVFEY